MNRADTGPRVSVVMPAFNAEQTIDAALASIFAQTYRDFEVIVVNDGSTDGTAERLGRWRGRVTCVHQNNGGPGFARNTAVGRARGELVAFLDADDLWLPWKLSQQVEYFDVFPETGLLHTATFLTDTPDAVSTRAGALAPSPPRHIFRDVYEMGEEIHTLTVMAPRTALLEVGLFDTRREVHVEDWDLWLRLAARYPVGYIASPLAIHRRGGGMSRAIEKTAAAQMEVIARHYATYRAGMLMSGADPALGARRVRARIALERARKHFEQNAFGVARRGFLEARQLGAGNATARVYSLVAALPPGMVRALRSLKRRARPSRAASRIVPAPRAQDGVVTRRSLVTDTAYWRIRRPVTERLHRIDTAVRALGRRRRILFDAASPLSFVVFKPIYDRLRSDPRIEMWFTSITRSWSAQAIFQSVGVADRVVSPGLAAWSKFDAWINTDFYEMPWLHRRTRRLHLFHGVAGKYRLDEPVHMAPDVATFHALLFPNRDRLTRYVTAGIIDPRAARLVGYPKVDRLVNGTIETARVARALDLRPGVPTVLYAPTWSPHSSLHTIGEAAIRRLIEFGFNVLVKLHDRSYDLTGRASGGIDWTARFAKYTSDAHVRIIHDPDAVPYMALADALVTDHSSIGFEYALLDRPIVVLDTPGLLARAGVNPAKAALLRDAAEVVDAPDDLERAITSQLASPCLHREARRRIAEEVFYRPGTATDRAVAIVYEAIGLEPPAQAAAELGGDETADGPVRQIA